MIRKGDVYYADLDPGIGSEQRGYRPIVVIQNDTGNKHSPTTIAAIVTSSLKKKLPTHVHVAEIESGLSEDSIVMLEQIRTIDKQRLGMLIGHVSQSTMKLIEDAAMCSLGIVR